MASLGGREHLGSTFIASREIERYDLEGRELAFSEEFVRYTTLITLRGGGEESARTLSTTGSTTSPSRPPALLPLTGSADSVRSPSTCRSSTFPDPPVRDVSRRYRNWAFESAALDLALRQAGRRWPSRSAASCPLTYVVSMRLGAFDSAEPETSDKMLRVLERYPGTRFQLDPTNTWSDELIEELAASGAVDSLDLKGQYKGTPVDVETDPSCTAS